MTDDLISRADAYKVLTDYYHHRTEFQHEALKEALDRVPSAQPKPEYIDNILIVRHYDNGMVAMNEECYERLQQRDSNLFQGIVAPADDKIYRNDLGAVIMNFKTFCKLTEQTERSE